MAIGSGTDRLMSDINVTPFVDVMLVLLIIFMVTAPMMTQGVDVALPEVAAKALPAEQDQLVVTVNKNNEIYINDYAVTLDMLGDKLSKILENRSSREIYFRADKDIPWGMGVRVMSRIREAGIEKLGIVTEPPSENPAEEETEETTGKSES
jgi:biopolymer transport protein TolR